MEKRKLILASGSPRRREILEGAGYGITVCVPKAEEISEGAPSDIVLKNALLKAEAAKEICRGVIICADTVVALEGKILGKPHTAENAERMLRLLSGKTHTVHTGYAVCDGEKTVSGVCVTKVFFREITDYEIEKYIATGSPLDKAGAYGIQDMGGMFISSVEGDYYTVVGLPICEISEVLRRDFGIVPDM